MGLNLNLFFRKLTVIGLVLTMAASAWAQSPPPPTGEVHSTGGPRRQLATIIFAGLGGAVLGLSTLSFYGRPQDQLANIAIGFAGGVIVGTTYVTYKAATNPAEFYGSARSGFEDEIERNRPHAQTAPKAPMYTFNFEF
jgi:hypothetical protein